MKIKKIVLGMAVVAVAGINVCRMNDCNEHFTDLQLDNIEKLAEGEPSFDCDGNPECICWHGAFKDPKIGYMISWSL